VSAKKRGKYALHHASALAQVAFFQWCVFGTAWLLPERLAPALEQLCRIAVGQHGAVFGNAFGRALLRSRRQGRHPQGCQCSQRRKPEKAEFHHGFLTSLFIALAAT
jgi:hypothetical protein